LHHLTHQTYTPYEIIIVNDRSSDSTSRLIADFQKNHPIVKKIDIVDISPDMPAKKNALRSGIAESRGDILCFTDADCFPPPRWLEGLVKEFKPDVGLVAGYSPYRLSIDSNISHGLFTTVLNKFIAYEEFRAAVWTAGSIGWNLGWLCTGRNLAYRRIVYDNVGGFERIKMSVSGDDDLFLQTVRKHTDWKICYAVSETTFVPTIPPGTLTSFIEQRKRHFSAAKYFTFPMKLFFFCYHSSNLFLLFSPLFFFMDLFSTWFILLGISVKLMSDGMLFLYSSRIFHVRTFIQSFLLMEVLYVVYNSLLGPLGLFQKFTWKQN